MSVNKILKSNLPAASCDYFETMKMIDAYAQPKVNDSEEHCIDR